MTASEMEAWFVREVLPLEAILMQYLHHHWRNKSEIDDLRQDVYVRIYESAQKEIPDPRKAFRVCDRAQSLIDRMRREQIVPIEAVADLDVLGLAADVPGPDRSAMARDELRRLQAALDRLPPRCREAVALNKIEGLSRPRDRRAHGRIAKPPFRAYRQRHVRARRHALRRRGRCQEGNVSDQQANASAARCRNQCAGGRLVAPPPFRRLERSDEAELECMACRAARASHRLLADRVRRGAAWTGWRPCSPRSLSRAADAPKILSPFWLALRRRFSVAAVLAAGSGFWIIQPREKTYSTALGERKTIALADGSRIELNTETVVSLHANAQSRIVSLEQGRGLFPDQARCAPPFVVMAGSHRVTDLGTKFVVRRDADPS